MCMLVYGDRGGLALEATMENLEEEKEKEKREAQGGYSATIIVLASQNISQNRHRFMFEIYLAILENRCLSSDFVLFAIEVLNRHRRPRVLYLRHLGFVIDLLARILQVRGHNQPGDTATQQERLSWLGVVALLV